MNPGNSSLTCQLKADTFDVFHYTGIAQYRINTLYLRPFYGSKPNCGFDIIG